MVLLLTRKMYFNDKYSILYVYSNKFSSSLLIEEFRKVYLLKGFMPDYRSLTRIPTLSMHISFAK